MITTYEKPMIEEIMVTTTSAIEMEDPGDPARCNYSCCYSDRHDCWIA